MFESSEKCTCVESTTSNMRTFRNTAGIFSARPVAGPRVEVQTIATRWPCRGTSWGVPANAGTPHDVPGHSQRSLKRPFFCASTFTGFKPDVSRPQVKSLHGHVRWRWISQSPEPTRTTVLSVTLGEAQPCWTPGEATLAAEASTALRESILCFRARRSRPWSLRTRYLCLLVLRVSTDVWRSVVPVNKRALSRPNLHIRHVHSNRASADITDMWWLARAKGISTTAQMWKSIFVCRHHSQARIVAAN